MIKTRITELLGIQHPIMLAGMSWITEQRIVAAVSNAGGLGTLACTPLTPDDMRRKIKEINELTDKPFGINQSLKSPTAKENVKVAIEERIPVINYSLGRPWFIDEVHDYGGKVTGTVALSRHAVRAEQLGVDGIIVTGHEAAAHGHVATSLVLIPLVASLVKVPIIAAGGFQDGRGLAAALVLGADAISMGTRFIMTKESKVQENFKKFIVKASEQDTLYSDVFDGMASRVLKTKEAEKRMQGGFPLFRAISSSLEIKETLNLSLFDFMRASFLMMKGGEEGSSLLAQARQAEHVISVKKAVEEDDVDRGILPAGQNIGSMLDIPTCRELVERTVREAEEVLTKISKQY